ncbi:MAG: CPBP family intramembrane metalloprotease [Clostridiales bacterium]|nr:CPBP family intramembrane metalloprotease [Clostridiales bacterium]
MGTNHKRIWSYLITTFLISWISWGIIILSNRFGYMAAGSVLYDVFVAIGGAGTAVSIIILKFKWKEFRNFRDMLKYVFWSEKLPFAFVVVALAFLWRFAIVFLFSPHGNIVPLYSLFVSLPYAATFSGGFEELGWRGFLQPELEKKLPFPIATLLTGIIWSCWHIPLFFIKGSSQSAINFMFFVFFIVVTSFTLAIIFRLTKNVFACALFHGWANVSFAIFAIQPSTSIIIAFSAEILLTIVIYMILVRRKQIIADNPRSAEHKRREAKRKIPPSPPQKSI